MTKQQLKRLAIVAAVIAAIVFIPYWVGIVSSAIFAPLGPGVSHPTLAFWIFGMISLVTVILAMGVIAAVSYLAAYIKNGKWG